MTIQDILETGVEIQAIVDNYKSAKEPNCLVLKITTQEIPGSLVGFFHEIKGQQLTLVLKNAKENL